MAGLAAAHRITELDPSIDVTLFEASERTGGLLRTERVDGYVIERGAESIITDKPWALALARRLGVDGELVSTRTDNRGAYVVAHGRLERIPEGFSLLAPVRLAPFLATNVLSSAGKARALLDLVLPRGARGEESLAQFVRRRFGPELLDRLAQPLVSGIYAAPSERLSLEATMPRFVEMERQARSVSYALWKRQRAASGEAASGARYGLFVSFRDGNERLVEALAERLGDRIRTSAVVTRVERRRRAYAVRAEGMRSVRADAVVVAVSARLGARLLDGLDPALAGALASIRHGSAAAVNLAWPRSDIPHPLDAYGFVVPVIEQRAVLASTWISRKWPARAPDGMELVRVFLGGAARPDVVRWSDAELVAAARRELGHFLGVRAAPHLVRVDRYDRSMPHYYVGHRALVDHIEEHVDAHDGLALAGSSYRGVGVPDTVRSAEAAAERVVAHVRRAE